MYIFRIGVGTFPQVPEDFPYCYQYFSIITPDSREVLIKNTAYCISPPLKCHAIFTTYTGIFMNDRVEWNMNFIKFKNGERGKTKIEVVR